MAQDSLISIILPTYNGARFINSAVRSILDQDYKNFELIIVDDASTDSTNEIIKSYAKYDSRITIITNDENKNLPTSLNIGHEKAKGEFITWTSDDNVLKKNFLSTLKNALHTQEYDIVYADYDIIFSDGSLKRKHQTGPTEALLFGNTIGAAFLYKMDVYDALSGYNHELQMFEDYDFWLRATMQFRFKHVSANIYQYRLQPESLTSSIKTSDEKRKEYTIKKSKSYSKLGDRLNWEKSTLDFFSKIDLKSELSFFFIKNNIDIFLMDLQSYAGEAGFSFLKIQEEFDLEIRRILLNFDRVTFKDIVWTLLNRPSILFSKKYSGRTTLKIFGKLFK